VKLRLWYFQSDDYFRCKVAHKFTNCTLNSFSTYLWMACLNVGVVRQRSSVEKLSTAHVCRQSSVLICSKLLVDLHNLSLVDLELSLKFELHLQRCMCFLVERYLPSQAHLEFQHETGGHILEELRVESPLLSMNAVICTRLMFQHVLNLYEEAIFARLSSPQLVKEMGTHLDKAFCVRPILPWEIERLLVLRSFQL
jgi:hypothetical protein